MLRLARSPVGTVMTVFFVQSLCAGGFFSRIAEIQRGMGASEAALGVALLGIDLGVLASIPFVSKLIERFGTRSILLVSLPLLALVTSLTALAPSAWVFFLVAILIGANFTTTNVAMNVEADRVEHAVGRRFLVRCHGMWSLGVLIASLAGTLATAMGVSPLLHLLAVVPVVLVATLVVVGPMIPSPPRPHSGVGAKRFAIPTLAVLLIGGFAIGGIWLEAGARSWSVIYIRDVFQPAAWIATLTLPVFLAMQVVGRFMADRWIERYGPVAVARTLACVALGGLLLVVSGANIVLSFAGFALIGLGVASSFPQALSAAARLGDRPSSENVAALSLIQSVAQFTAPPIMGITATYLGIRVSYALIVPLVLLAIVLARNLAERPVPAAAVTVP